MMMLSSHGYLSLKNIHIKRNLILNLNRIFADISECIPNSNNGNDKNDFILEFKEDDYRCQHIKKILKLDIGDSLRGGIINMGMSNTWSIIRSDDNDGISIDIGNINDLEKRTATNLVDLILAVPRPLRLERLLPVISCMGVGRIILVGGEKVEKDYFGSHLFRNPSAVKKCLVEGLEQAEVDYILPEIIVRKDLKKFLVMEEKEMFPSSSYYKFIAHPFPAGDTIPKRMKQYMNDNNQVDKNKKIVIVIGPEGGWTTEEVQTFIMNEYNLINIGDRILRTDMAVPCLLGLAHEHIAI